MTLRGIHRTSAILLSAFACLHIANHLASLSSVAAHIAFMDAARSIYRHSVIEIALLLSVVIQIASGMRAETAGLRRWQALSRRACTDPGRAVVRRPELTRQS